MTVTLFKVKEISGVTAFSNFSYSTIGRSVVFNPTLPALVFDYNTSDGNIHVALVVGNTQEELYPGATGGSNLLSVQVPVIFYSGYIVVGGNVCGQSDCMNNGSDLCGPWFVSYDTQNNTYVQNCSAEPTNSITVGLQDVIVDYINQYIYLFHNGTPDPSALLFAVPFSEATSFLANLQPPSSYKIAYLRPTNPPSSMTIYKGKAVLYGSTLYITGSASGDIYVWAVPFSEITWNSSYPSSPQSIGSLYQVYNGGNSVESVIYLNYYLSSGNVVAELLIYVSGGSGTNGYAGMIYIYSFNLTTNTATRLFSISDGANATWVAVNINGVLAFGQYISSGTFVVSIYDRKTNTYQQSSQITGALTIYISEPYYLVVLSGSPSSMTITIYQILLDVIPIFTNVTLNNGVLSGQILNLNGNQPLANVGVYLFTLSVQGDDASYGTIIQSITTDSNGKFSLTIPKIGYYALKVIQ